MNKTDIQWLQGLINTSKICLLDESCLARSEAYDKLLFQLESKLEELTQNSKETKKW